MEEEMGEVGGGRGVGGAEAFMYVRSLRRGVLFTVALFVSSGGIVGKGIGGGGGLVVGDFCLILLFRFAFSFLYIKCI